MIVCRHEHESISTCISKRYKQSERALQQGTFATRRALESGIADECSSSIGSCLSTESGQPICNSISLSTPTPSTDPTTTQQAPETTSKKPK